MPVLLSQDCPIDSKYSTHLFCILSLVKLYKCILQGICRLLVTDDLATHNSSKSREYQFQVLVPSDWIEFADEKNIFWWPNICKRQVTDHFKRQSRGRCSLLSTLSLLLLFW